VGLKSKDKLLTSKGKEKERERERENIRPGIKKSSFLLELLEI